MIGNRILHFDFGAIAPARVAGGLRKTVARRIIHG
jgi:hypothetical protein